METTPKRELTLTEIQAREYELLKQFDAYCKRHGLTYCLCGGTLLGAVRHKGFIPWDDDIDLMMPREDYERLRDLSRGETVSDCLRVRYPGDAGYPYGFMKAVDTRTVVYERNITRDEQRTGLALDIFPLDRMYVSPWKNRLLLTRVKFWIQVGKVGAGMVRAEKDSLKKRLRNLEMCIRDSPPRARPPAPVPQSSAPCRSPHPRGFSPPRRRGATARGNTLPISDDRNHRRRDRRCV